ncbi:MAG: hypothetical protein AAFU71_13250 [Cyanobacteria bacterium J06632_22]
MLQTSILDVAASTAFAANPAPAPQPTETGCFETVSHVLFGNPSAVRLTIQDLHKKRYAEPNDWSKLLPTGRPNEVMAILTRRIRVEP